mgnify:CR=1 FL=1|jgi:hypothetical protein
MFYNYEPTKKQSIKVRKVKPQAQVPYLHSESVVNTRSEEVRKFGATFLLRVPDAPQAEQAQWETLGHQLKKRLPR